MSGNVAKIAQYVKNCKGFEKIIECVKIIKAGDGQCLAEYTVLPEHSNIIGNLHGGYSATLVDTISSFALFFTEKGECASVSTDMHMTYLKGAKVGEELVIDAKTMKIGKSLAYLNVEMKNKSTGDLLVKGTHTKYLLN